MENRLLLAYYGDDFTGSTDAMEALTIYGLDNILFLEVPDKTLLNAFKEVQCIGIAGTARAKTKKDMEDELEPIFRKVSELNPKFFHYKVCSTFDSSPTLGSIGFAADLARKHFNTKQYNLLAGVPQLGRYTVFGHHFAKKDDKVYRLDQHPVMSVHPVTPMDESDLAKHLSKQTNQSVGNVTVNDLKTNEVQSLKEKTSLVNKNIIIFDALEEQHLSIFANYLNNLDNKDTQFIIGSSGVEYAIGNHWGNKINAEKKSENPINGKCLVVSGSLSEITSEQMHHAIDEGFKTLQIPVETFYDNESRENFVGKVNQTLNEHERLIIYTADGPEDTVIESTKKYIKQMNKNGSEVGELIGKKLGELTNTIIRNHEIDKLIISGGDTSGFVMKELGVYALKVFSTISPGAPLCKVFSHDPKISTMKIALKGGQLGEKDYYKKVAEH